jgi:VanZ family protein
MTKVRIFVRNWLPVIAWAAVIYLFSSDSGSFARTSSLFGPWIRSIFPAATEEVVRSILVCIRKAGHMAEYSILAILLWRALASEGQGRAQVSPPRLPVVVLLLVLLYAASDEIHQAFVPGREAAVRDVVIDLVGGVTGLVLIWVFRGVRRRRQVNRAPA